MKYVGILLVLASAFISSREFSRRMDQRVAECKDFLAFIAHMRIQVGCFLRPVKELGEGFSSPALERVGFIAALKECDRIYDAYSKCEGELSLSDAEREVLNTLFSSFGEGYLDDGIKLIDNCHSAMERLYLKLCEEKTKNTRLVTALSVTAALGVIIFVI